MEAAIMVRDTVHLTFHSSAPFGNTRAGYSKRGDASRTRQWPIGFIQGEGMETKSLISAAKQRTWFQISSGKTGSIVHTISSVFMYGAWYYQTLINICS